MCAAAPQALGHTLIARIFEVAASSDTQRHQYVGRVEDAQSIDV